MKNHRNSIQKALTLVSSAAPEANLLAAIASIALVLKIFGLNRFAQPFRGAYEIGLAVEAVLASVVASYIFYLFVVHLPSYRAQQQIEPFVRRKLHRLVGDAKATIAEISNASGVLLTLSECTQESLSEALSRIDIHSDTPLHLADLRRRANWLEFFQYRASRTQQCAVDLIKRVTLLNATRVRLVTEIDDCRYFRMLTSRLSSPFKPVGSLHFISDVQYSYFLLCRELEETEGMGES